jgi:hypothetical protein
MSLVLCKLNISRLFWYLVLFNLSAVIITGCGVYSFTGASISPEVNTISIQQFPNNASLVEPTLSQKFTDALKDKFVAQTNLDLVDKAGDLRMSGEIVGYKVTPVAIQSDETSAMNRLTIIVKVEYTNTVDGTKDFSSSFSRYEDYPSSQSLETVQATLIDQINDMLVEDIFNKAVVNW